MALLSELLSEIENAEYSGSQYPKNITSKNIKQLTVEELSKIGLFLINSEYGSIPDCTISAEAISILNKRARMLGIAIF